jgi:hypothetical protein
MMSKRPVLVALLISAFAPAAAPAQLLGGPVGGVTRPVIGTIGQIGNAVDQTANRATNSPLSRDDQARMVAPSLDRVATPLAIVQTTADQLAALRELRLEALVQANRATLDRDGDGRPVRRNELIVANPEPADLSAAVHAGFRVIEDENAGDLGLRIVTLAPPSGMNIRQAMKALRRASPALDADFNHVYEPAGGALLPATAATLAAAQPVRAGVRIAMIDGGVASHPSLAGAAIDQRGFAGNPQPTGHGTAVGSLLVGDQGPFRGAARGAQLFVGDVYGGNPAAGSATGIVRALAWAASKRPSVINISLIGPRNRLLERAVGALRSRGISLVAAVGNDGPAAPPQYPASYPGVIAVTGVDSADRALREASRATHLDFAAPGADLVAALPGNGYTPVRGTSFAAPFVAARLAAAGSIAQLAAEAMPGKGRVGRGIVCRNCRVTPKMVGLKLK